MRDTIHFAPNQSLFHNGAAWLQLCMTSTHSGPICTCSHQLCMWSAYCGLVLGRRRTMQPVRAFCNPGLIGLDNPIVQKGCERKCRSHNAALVRNGALCNHDAGSCRLPVRIEGQLSQRPQSMSGTVHVHPCCRFLVLVAPIASSILKLLRSCPKGYVGWGLMDPVSTPSLLLGLAEFSSPGQP
jgi:hypothetical protein